MVPSQLTFHCERVTDLFAQVAHKRPARVVTLRSPRPAPLSLRPLVPLARTRSALPEQVLQALLLLSSACKCSNLL